MLNFDDISSEEDVGKFFKSQMTQNGFVRSVDVYRLGRRFSNIQQLIRDNDVKVKGEDYL